MKNKIKAYKTIEIPHLKFTVYVKDLSELKGIDAGASTGFVCEMKGFNACLFLKDVKETVKHIENTPHIAHEIMHVIQIICKKYNMNIVNEQEHTAYLMFYLLEEIIK